MPISIFQLSNTLRIFSYIMNFINSSVDHQKLMKIKDKDIYKVKQSLHYSLEEFLRYQNTFKKLVSKIYLLKSNNGVLQLTGKYFQSKKFDNYISMTVGYDYTEANNKEKDKLF